MKNFFFMIIAFLIFALSISSCKVKTGQGQAPVKRVIGVYRPFTSTLPNTINDVNFKCKYFTKVQATGGGAIVNYDSKALNKTRNNINKTEQYWEVDLNLPTQYAGYAVDVFIEWLECAWPNNINANSAIDEYEGLSPILTSPQNVILQSNAFSVILSTQC